MSVQTTADDRLEDAANHLQAAVQALSDLVIGECFGYEDFGTSTQEDIQRALVNLLFVRNIPVMSSYRNRTGRGVGNPR